MQNTVNHKEATACLSQNTKGQTTYILGKRLFKGSVNKDLKWLYLSKGHSLTKRPQWVLLNYADLEEAQE